LLLRIIGLLRIILKIFFLSFSLFIPL